MTLIPQFVRRWQTHWAAGVTMTLAIVALSIPAISASEYPVLAKLVDALLRASNIATGAVFGYWMGRWHLKIEYAKFLSAGLSGLTQDEYNRFQGWRLGWAALGVIGWTGTHVLLRQ